MATRAKTYDAEASIELSAPLWLGPEFLGLLKPARIGGVDVHIVLPDFERNFVGRTVLHSRSRYDWLGFFAGDRDDDRDWPFGGVAKWKQDEIVEFTANRLLALPRHRVTLANARKFKAAVDDWVELFELWIEVVAREDLHRCVPVEEFALARLGLVGRTEEGYQCKPRLSLVLPKWRGR